MPTSICSVCSRPDAAAIDKALVAGGTHPVEEAIR
jgi:hypothetical protein